VSRIENEVANSGEEFAQRFWQMRDAARGIPLDSEKQAGRNGLLHVYFELKDYSHPLARRTTLALYAIGFGIMLVPSADVFFRVVRLMFKTVLASV